MFAHPTPQSRDRIYIVFWKKGNPAPDLDIRPESFCHKCDKLVQAVQSWKNPEKKWGCYQRQYIYCCPDCGNEVTPFYYSAINCIDWSIEADKIGERDRPLADNTIERIEYGLERYGNRPLIIRKGEAIEGVSKSPYFVEMGYTHSGKKRAKDIQDPAPTQTQRNNIALTVPPAFTVQMNSTGKAKSFEEELPTVLSGGMHHALVRAPFITEHYGNSDARSITERLGCLTTKETYGLVTPPFIAELYGQSNAKPMTKELGCVTAGGANQALISTKSVTAFLSYYYGQAQASGMHEPAGTLSTRDRMALVTQDLEKPELEECTFRMLKDHELQRAQGFPDEYVILGNVRERVKQIGNANPPKTIKLLVERCIETLKP
jgi:DNA (cytosine-5)-methyltransferase 1